MGLTSVDNDRWYHVDFLWTTDANKYFNDMLLDFIKNVTTNPNFITESVVRMRVKREQNPQSQSISLFNETAFKIAQILGLMKAVNQISKSLKPSSEHQGGKKNMDYNRSRQTTCVKIKIALIFPKIVETPRSLSPS